MNAAINELEGLNEARENIRVAVSAGSRTLRDLGADIDEVLVDDCNDAEAAAEGGVLGLYYFDELKADKYKQKPLRLGLLNSGDKVSAANWERGVIAANGQNLARRLMEMPANLMTPTIFANTVAKLAEPLGVKVHIRDRQWAEAQKMNSFLSVTNGSDEPPVFLEMHYNNAPGTEPLALVGKGITFDTGGISIKPSSNMDKMRADMGGAANVAAAIITLATLKAKVNVIGNCSLICSIVLSNLSRLVLINQCLITGLTPLAENMPSGKATKPGDVIVARNGKTIQVDNTDAEGRLVLADALDYAHDFKPQAIVDLATLTGAMVVALGSAATGCFTNSTPLFELIAQQGVHTGDRMWRMPLYNHFSKQVTDSQLAGMFN